MKNRKIDPEIEEKLKEKIPANVFNNIGPKQLYNMEAFLDMSGGWRAGYTKPTIEARKKQNRMKNKSARKSRKINRK